MARIGVLALQGGYAAHAQVLAGLGHTAVEVRSAEALTPLDGLVLPGGESTTQLKLLARNHMKAPLTRWVATGKPLLATCAGVVLAAARVSEPEQESFGWLDIAVHRNGWGRQVHSFEAVSDAGLPMVFIRAPRIVGVGERVEILETLDGEPVMVRQGAVVGVCFHPELTDHDAVHQRVFGQPGFLDNYHGSRPCLAREAARA